MAYVPKGSFQVIDTWFVGGLRGTGSHDVAVEDIFVPAERTYSFAEPAYLDRPLYRMPPVATLSAGCASTCIGIAQAAIEALVELAMSKVQVDARLGLRDRPEVQDMVAASEAALDAARLLLHDAIGETWANCDQNLPVTDKQRIRIWSAANHAAKAAKAIVASMYEAAGTPALYQNCPLERAHRDIHAVGQHIVLSHGWLNDAGRVRLGLEASNPLFYL
jgi:alkylation response protein AidB-like acyl-CoA dehydrogenase